jgi:hypothetical protein
MAKTYQILFLDIIGEKEEFRQRLCGLGADSTKVDQILNNTPLVIRRGLSLKIARMYAEAIQEAGGRVSIQEHGSIDDDVQNHGQVIRTLDQFTMCSECGFKQVKASFCIRCGRPLPGEKQ